MNQRHAAGEAILEAMRLTYALQTGDPRSDPDFHRITQAMCRLDEAYIFTVGEKPPPVEAKRVSTKGRGDQ